MAVATHTVPPIFRRVRNFQWYWNSAVDPWSSATCDTWMKYTDIENEIIEDARVSKQPAVEIDGNYIISLKDQVQINKLDKSKQRPIKRVQLQSNRPNTHLREDRFSLPIINRTVPPSASVSSTENDKNVCLWAIRNGSDFPLTYYKEYVERFSKTFADIVEEAARGMIIEGTKIVKKHEAEWLAKQLRSVKCLSDVQVEHGGYGIPREIGEMCVFLYTKECFWYKLINSVLRSTNHVLPREQMETLGPFSFLLAAYLQKLCKRNDFIVYRGVTLTDEERKEYMPSEHRCFHFTSFTSTSLNREKAEAFGNTLFIINLDAEIYYSNARLHSGVDISFLSDFPDEQEVLIWPATSFDSKRYEYDHVKNRHVIYMEATDTAP